MPAPVAMTCSQILPKKIKNLKMAYKKLIWYILFGIYSKKIQKSILLGKKPILLACMREKKFFSRKISAPLVIRPVLYVVYLWKQKMGDAFFGS